MGNRHLVTAAARWAASDDWRVLEVREGLTETNIYLESLVFGRRQYLRLVTNSLSMSSTRFNARRYMKLYVYLPVAVHSNPRSALLISYGVGYFTVHESEGGYVDWEWLDSLPAEDESRWLRHVRLPEPLETLVDFRRGAGVILKRKRDSK